MCIAGNVFRKVYQKVGDSEVGSTGGWQPATASCPVTAVSDLTLPIGSVQHSSQTCHYSLRLRFILTKKRIIEERRLENTIIQPLPLIRYYIF